ncbi:MAG: restriction endonuclease subunit S [Flavobacteriaceae bacterium]|nr:restriction endonuclease subunit S [Flavobacteriaceae bacterium]
MKEELPSGWERTIFKETVTYKKGKKPKVLTDEEFENSVPYLDIKALEHGEIRRYADIESSNILDANSIAIVWDGARSGWVAKGVYGSMGSTIAALTPILMDVDYTHQFLRSQFENLNNNTRGTGIPHVNPDILWNIETPIPPLPEQKRIVAKLDALFGHLDTLKAKLDRIPELLQNFRQQVLTQAVTGKLTEEWREGKGLGEWDQVKMEDLTISITDGDHQAPPKVEKGIPFLVISNVNDGNLNIDSASRFVPQDYYDNLKDSRKPQPDDILYTVTGSIGIPVMVESEKPFTFQRHIAIIRPDKKLVDPKYLHIVLQSENSLSQAKEVATGTAQVTIPLRGLRNYNIPYPGIQEQKEIINRVHAIFKVADSIESQYLPLKVKIDNLPQAILNKAFKGELVPQDPNDEPASVLLERIKEEKEATKKRGGKS